MIMIHVNRLKWMKHLLAIAVILALPLPGFSWGAGGHMIVARIAYTRLNRTAKAKVDRLVKVKINPENITSTSLSFVAASHWADDLRSFPEFDFLKDLHFIDHPFSTDNSTLPSNLPGEKHIVSALMDNVNVLKTSTDDKELAQALRLVIHFVGDIHQPLHCATRVTQAHLQGDRGGNDFSIKLRGDNNNLRNSNLHSYWDSGIGNFPKTGANFAPPPLAEITPAAVRITGRFPADTEDWQEGGVTGFEQWSEESEKLAQNTAYKNIRERQVPSAGYNQAALAVAQRRVAWAGYRLAELLNSIWPEQQ
jgi:hypothetical protein